MSRKKRLRLIQFSLLIIGSLVIFFSYYHNKFADDEKIIQAEEKKLIEKKIQGDTQGDVFYDIEYSGIDLSGNRFILKSEKAITNPEMQNSVNLIGVEATFYFEDETTLKVWSDFGEYNNQSLDIIFKENVKANYIDSKLFADLADYSNSNNSLTITNNVKLVDKSGILTADKLYIDIQLKTLDIQTFNENKINANLNIK